MRTLAYSYNRLWMHELYPYIGCYIMDDFGNAVPTSRQSNMDVYHGVPDRDKY